MALDQQLEAAYRKTKYTFPDQGIELLYGQNNSRLDSFLYQGNWCELCVLTAYNPFSEIQSEERNADSLQQMKVRLEQLGFIAWKGRNVDPDQEFPDEATWWVPGMSQLLGLEIARKWNQNAFLYYTTGGNAQLILAISSTQ